MRRSLSVMSRSLFVLFIFVLSFGQFSSHVYSAEPTLLVPCTGTIRIMPLGDSITQGSASGVIDPTLQTSYRMDLYNSLIDSGYEEVDFVGSQTSGENVVPPFDPNHEGHPGWADWEIAYHIYNNGGANWLGDLGANWPHIILLHIGTNYLDTDESDVESILNEIDEYETDTGHHITVILARIIDIVPGGNVTLHTFNDNVQAMAEARTDDDIVIVDMEDGAGLIYRIQPAGDFYNNLHPYATGYTKMAPVWKDALDQLFLSCGGNTPPEIISDPGDQSNLENSTITPLDFDATDPDVGQTITWSATNLPGSLSIDPESGIISGTISDTAAAGSPYSVTVKARDNGFPPASDSYAFTWEVTTPEPIAKDESYNTDEDVQLKVAAPGVLKNDSDPEGDPLTAIYVSGPEHGTLALYATGAFNYTPEANYFGTDSFTYKATDGTFDSNPATVSITVNPVNDLQAINPGSQISDEEESISLPIQVMDAEGRSLSFGMSGAPTGLSIAENTGLISGKVLRGAAQGSPYQVTVTVSEGTDTDMVIFSWTVNKDPRLFLPMVTKK